MLLVFSGCTDDGGEQKSTKPFEVNHKGTIRAKELQYLLSISGLTDVPAAQLQYDVDVYALAYPSTYKSEPITASGLLLVPKAAAQVGVISFQRGTMILQSEAPSLQPLSSYNTIVYAALASTGRMTLVPDMIGFGASKEIFHPYYLEEPSANAVVDMIQAAKKFAEQEQLKLDGKLLLAGYSQGGYITLAAHKAIEAKPLEGLNLQASFPAAGGYDLTHLQSYFTAQRSYSQPFYLAFLAYAFQQYYEKPELLKLIFSEPYASRIPSLMTGTKSPGAINASLTTDMETLFTREFKAGAGSANYEALKTLFERESPIDFVPRIPIHFYHGTADLTVPEENTIETIRRLRENGASDEIITYTPLPGENHSSGILAYIREVLKKAESM